MPKVMKKRYEPRTDQQRIGLFIEECGEALSALGKSIRWGLDKYNPELPAYLRELNRDWLLRELADLERGIGYARITADDGGFEERAARRSKLARKKPRPRKSR